MDIFAGFGIAVRDFFERGGGVLLVLGLIILTMWTLILSRWLYLRKEYRYDISPIVEHWIRWKEQDSALWNRLKAEAFDSVGGTQPADGPLQLPESGTPSGSFFDLGGDRGYGKIMIRGNDSGFYLAVNTASYNIPRDPLACRFIRG